MAKREKTAGPARNAAGPGVLRWEVFVTPPLPIVTRDRPPGVRETFFQATASTLIYGARDAVLVDAFMTVRQATALADWVAARGKNLTTIYITHGHGDHWFGLGTLLERFPKAKAVATPNAVKEMHGNASPQALAGRALGPVIDALGTWGYNWASKDLEDERRDPDFLMWA